MMPDFRAAASARRAAAGGDHPERSRPNERRSAPDGPVEARPPVAFRAELRAASEGDTATIDGYASVTESPYEMWDYFGAYTEVISRGAFAKTLAEGADIAYLLNHGGMTLARTKSGTLDVTEDETGLRAVARVDTRMTVVRDMVLAIERGDLDEMSFAFRIIRGQWSPDYTEYRIDEVSLAKGDVSVVNYGANPATSVGLREAPAVEVAQRATSGLVFAPPAHVRAIARRLTPAP